ncbi:hypothetical protein ALC60_09096, partial [Trachymyrmex zeteki]
VENNNKYLTSTLFASISVTFKPVIRPVISTIHICSQIVAIHKFDNFTLSPVTCPLLHVSIVICFFSWVFLTSATAHTALSASPLNPNVRNASESDETRDIRIRFIAMSTL